MSSQNIGALIAANPTLYISLKQKGFTDNDIIPILQSQMRPKPAYPQQSVAQQLDLQKRIALAQKISQLSNGKLGLQQLLALKPEQLLTLYRNVTQPKSDNNNNNNIKNESNDADNDADNSAENTEEKTNIESKDLKAMCAELSKISGDTGILSELSFEELQSCARDLKQCLTNVNTELEKRYMKKYTCPLCNDRSKSIVIIPCGHSFCAQCCDTQNNLCPQKGCNAKVAQKVSLG